MQAIVPAVWDVVRVAFPFADRDEVRYRPSLVIAAVRVQSGISLLWLAMITSASSGRWPFDVPVTDLASGGLLRPCVVRTSKVATLDARLAVRIGELAASDRPSVAAALGDVLVQALSG